ncbi:hypothetical protein [Streptomyces silvensis]|uniref:Uncharacterized protein n=1 Tax=Streptomyces silvensis TaxID=1765722 RepID=A0A0W7X7L8_9ACTN|nr:hypothetical protein [Streptomyces silvensis]KUF18831.1 hypothetical protein AT728_07290 [Streptomyces silvensis]
MTEYISFVPFRREEWKAHPSKRAVRQAIAYDKGRGDLRIFSRGVSGTGAIFFLEVSRDDWEALFSG